MTTAKPAKDLFPFYDFIRPNYAECHNFGLCGKWYCFECEKFDCSCGGETVEPNQQEPPFFNCRDYNTSRFYCPDCMRAHQENKETINRNKIIKEYDDFINQLTLDPQQKCYLDGCYGVKQKFRCAKHLKICGRCDTAQTSFLSDTDTRFKSENKLHYLCKQCKGIVKNAAAAAAKRQGCFQAAAAGINK